MDHPRYPPENTDVVEERTRQTPSRPSRGEEGAALPRQEPPEPSSLEDKPLFSNRNFLLLFLSDTVSVFGDRLSVFALFILLFGITGRAVDMGVLMIVQAVPAVLIGPLAGVHVDRVQKKKLLIITHLIQAALTALIPFAKSIFQVYLIAGSLSVVRQFFNPARLALLPEIVKEKDLTRANSLEMVTTNILMILGPASAGVIVGFFGTSPAFFVDAATFLVAATVLSGLSALGKGSEIRKPTGGYFSAFREGVRFMLENPLLRYLVPFLALLILVGSMQSPLLVVFTKRVLLRGDIELGILMGATGVGGILGGLFTGIFGGKASRVKNITRLFIADGFLLIAFAVNRNFPLGVSIFVLFGTLGTALQIILLSLLQEHVPGEKRGRVFANLTPILGPLSIASIGIGTFLADLVGVAYILAASGAAECLSGLLAPFFPRYKAALRELDGE